MAELSPEIASLLREMRSHLAQSNDAWEKRRELMQKVNELVPGGEVDMFVGTVREMARMGASYSNILQAFQQLVASQQGAADFSNLMSRNFPVGGLPFPGPFDYFKQMSEFMASAAQATQKPQAK